MAWTRPTPSTVSRPKVPAAAKVALLVFQKSETSSNARVDLSVLAFEHRARKIAMQSLVYFLACGATPPGTASGMSGFNSGLPGRLGSRQP